LPRNLATEPYIGTDADDAVYLRIAAGIGGTTMTPYGDALVSSEDRWALVAYLRSLREATGVQGKFSAPPADVLLALRVDGNLPESVDAPLWKDVAPAPIPISTIWRRSDATRAATLRAVHDGREIAFLLEWENPDPAREEGRIQDYVDRASLQFSIRPEPGFVGMGDPLNPVVLWQWAALSDLTKADMVTAAYPSRKTDIYPDAGDTYYSAMMAGNPISDKPAGGVEEAMAHGPGTLTTIESPSSRVHGAAEWKDGVWRVLFRRLLSARGARDVEFAPGRKTPVAIGIWDGKQADRDGRKNVTSWLTLELQP